MGGRPPQPLELAKLKGAVKHDPQRFRGTPSGSPMEIGQPPAHMKQGAQLIWFEILGCMPPGVVTASERIALETLSNLMLEYRADPFGFPAMKHSVIDRKLSELGLTPVSRRRIIVPAKPKENSFAEFVTKQ